MPKYKADIITAIEAEDPRAAQLVLQLVQQREQIAVLSAPTAPLPAAETARVVPLPSFSEKNARVWFDQVDTMLAHCSPGASKSSLIGALTPDVILKSGAKLYEDYDSIKACIVSHYGESDERKLHQLLSEQHLGDRKPSTALRELQRLAPGSPDLIKMRFLEMLPESVRVVLATLDTSVTLEDVAEVADKMMEQLPSSSSSIRSITDQSESVSDLRSMVAQVTADACRLTSDFQLLKRERPLNAHSADGLQTRAVFDRMTDRAQAVDQETRPLPADYVLPFPL